MKKTAFKLEEKFIRFKDKICAILTILQCREFALFTCQNFNTSDNATCRLSIGVENKKDSEIFRKCISEYIITFE